MNKHILLVMKWLNDKDSVTQKELEENRTAAADTYTDAYAYAAAAACAAAYAWVNKYFEQSGDNKQDYIDELNGVDCVNADKTKPVFTQAMADNNELPQVGMLFVCDSGEKAELLLPIDEDGYGVTMFDGKYCLLRQLSMLPIDTRTDKEKAIDDISNEFLKGGNTFRHVLEAAYDKWVGK